MGSQTQTASCVCREAITRPAVQTAACIILSRKSQAMHEVDLLTEMLGCSVVLLDVRVTSFIIMLATAVNVWVSHRGSKASAESADAAKRASDAAERSATIAKDSVAVSIKAMEIGNRPYLALERVGQLATDPDGEVIIPVNVKVLGKLPVVIREAVLKHETGNAFIAPGKILMPSESIQTICFFPHPAMLALYKKHGAVGLTLRIAYEAVGLGSRYLVEYEGLFSTEGYDLTGVSMT